MIRNGNRVFLCAALCLAAALAMPLGGCESGGKSEKPKPKVKKGEFKGTDYHSTALRARERAVEQLKEVDDTRKEQVKEARQFDKK